MLDTGGIERVAVQIASALLDGGWNAVVASPLPRSGARSGGATKGPLERELTAMGATHVELPAMGGNPFRIWANTARLARITRERNVKLVHARAPWPAWSAAFAAKRASIPFMTTFHEIYEGHDRFIGKRVNSVMTAGDRVIAVSDYVQDHIREVYDVEPSRIRVVRRGIDTRLFDPSAVRGHRVAALSERWQLGYERRIVMLPGSVVRSKGHLVMLEAMSLCREDDFLLLVVGDLEPGSAYVREIEREILARGLSDRVHFGGHCDDMAAAYMLADVVALPATGSEAYGRMVVEAQAMGKPVVVTNVGGLPETVMPASTGWLVAPGDPDELAWALRLALSLEDDVKVRLAERARSFVMEELSVEQMCRRTLDLYRELVRDAPRKPHADQAA